MYIKEREREREKFEREKTLSPYVSLCQWLPLHETIATKTKIRRINKKRERKRDKIIITCFLVKCIERMNEKKISVARLVDYVNYL